MLLLGAYYFFFYLHYNFSPMYNNKCFNFSQQIVSDETTQFFALPFIKYDISLASILSKGKGTFFSSFIIQVVAFRTTVYNSILICLCQVPYPNWLQSG